MNCNNIETLPQMGFWTAVKHVIGNLTDFNGRARRSEYWWFILAETVVNLICQELLTAYPNINLVVSAVLGLFTYAVLARRLNDTGKNGKILAGINFILDIVTTGYLLKTDLMGIASAANPNVEGIIEILMNPFFIFVMAISAIYSVILFVFCIFDGNIDENEYGTSPKYVRTDTNGKVYGI